VKRYAKYRDTGVKAIGKIPSDWETVKTAYAFSFGRGLSISRENMNDVGIPCVHYGEIHARYGFAVDPAKNKLPCIDESYLQTAPQALLKYGDYLFVGSSEDIEGSGNFTYLNSDIPAFAGSDTIILRVKREINYRYVAYMFDSLSYRKQIRSEVYGVKVFHPTQSIIKKVIGVYPPLYEQAAIASYLDCRTAKIDETISDLQLQAEMLNHYKQELITNTITRGLNKDVPTKDSEVDWIGEVPTNWEITKTKWLFEIVKRIYGKEDRDILSITQRGIKVKDIESNDGQLAESYSNYQVVNINDFAMNSMDLLTGYVDCSQFEGVTSPDYRVFRFFSNKPQCHSYYKYLFQMCYKRRIFYRLGQGVSNFGRWRLQADQFLNMKLPQPPIHEQEEIAAYLDKKITRVENLIADINKQIEKLKQYRQIIIHDAVTGKIKVSEVSNNAN